MKPIAAAVFAALSACGPLAMPEENATALSVSPERIDFARPVTQAPTDAGTDAGTVDAGITCDADAGYLFCAVTQRCYDLRCLSCCPASSAP